ncbi:MAG: terminase family protein, partial [Candidatus Uhrbacteria bacterium]
MKQMTDQQIAEKLLKDKRFRKEVTTSSHYWFFHTYFNEYVKYPTAKFQREMFEISEAETTGLAVITAFRGSGKSTIITLSFPIWAILGKQQRKFVVILSQTQAQAKMHLQNLRTELEANELLRHDLGPFEERNEEWSSGSLVIPKHNARITAMSMEQSIRGIRHGSHRPDLIICDDVEDLASV